MSSIKYEKENRQNETADRHAHRGFDKFGREIALRNSGLKKKSGVSGSLASSVYNMNKSMRGIIDWGINSSKTLLLEETQTLDLNKSRNFSKNKSSSKKQAKQVASQVEKAVFNMKLNRMLNTSTTAKFLQEASVREENPSRFLFLKENRSSQFQLNNLLHSSTLCSTMNLEAANPNKSRSKKPSIHTNTSCSSRLTPKTALSVYSRHEQTHHIQV